MASLFRTRNAEQVTTKPFMSGRRNCQIVFWIIGFGTLYFFLCFWQPEQSQHSWSRLEAIVADFNFASHFLLRRYIATCGQKEVTPEGIFCLNRDVPFQAFYSDRLSLSWRCWVPIHYRRFVYHSLRFWMSLAAKHNITWWLTDGSLIGALRHHDVIPFDHDGDIMIAPGEESKLRQVEKPNEVFHQGLNIRLRPRNGRRQDCYYRQVPFQIDACAFIDPYARIVQSTDYFFDVFSSSKHNTTHLRLTDGHLFPEFSIFPLKLCQFMNMTVPCPKESPRFLSEHYPNFQKMNKHCIFGRLWL